MFNTNTAIRQNRQDPPLQKESCPDKGLYLREVVGTLTAMPPRDLGQRVRKVRMARGMSQNQLEIALAGKLGRKSMRGYISMLEAGKRGSRPGDSFITALCEILRTSREYLREGEGPMFAEGGSPDRKSAKSGQVPAVTRAPEYPSLEQWLMLASHQKLDADVVASMKLDYFADGDPGVQFWTKRYQELIQAKDDISKLGLEPIEGEDV